MSTARHFVVELIRVDNGTNFMSSFHRQILCDENCKFKFEAPMWHGTQQVLISSFCYFCDETPTSMMPVLMSILTRNKRKTQNT